MSTYDFNLITAFANSAPSNEIEPFPDYDRGLGIAFDETDGKPEMKGLNGLFSLLTVSLLALKQRGILTWTTGFEYKQGAFVVESNRLYQAKTDNTSKQPSLSQNEWQVWASVSDIDVDTNGNIIKTAKAGGAFTLKVEDASTTAKGVARFATATEVINKSNVSAAVTPSNTATIAQSTDLGVGQLRQNLTALRSLGITYTNTTPKPIELYVLTRNRFSGVTAEQSTLFINGIAFVFEGGGVGVDGAFKSASITMTIQPNETYRVVSNTGGTLILWAELR